MATELTIKISQSRLRFSVYSSFFFMYLTIYDAANVENVVGYCRIAPRFFENLK